MNMTHIERVAMYYKGFSIYLKDSKWRISPRMHPSLKETPEWKLWNDGIMA